ncbi:MAG: FixH family protein [Flavobacteriales bacterium]|nr:FixH family protein [Flavobacteriales bacterium]
MSWGWRIALFYGTFVVFMVGMVIMAFREDFDLVADDYYEQEIAYQGRIDQMTNAQVDGQKVIVSEIDGLVRLSFASQATEVKIHFFRPSDEAKDFRQEEVIVDRELNIPTEKFSSGKYLIKVEWKANDKTYFQEQDFIVN